jgi:integrase
MSIRKRTWKSNGSEKTAWCVDYVDQSGKRRLKTFTLKKDAEAWATNASTRSRKASMRLIRKSRLTKR